MTMPRLVPVSFVVVSLALTGSACGNDTTSDNPTIGDGDGDTGDGDGDPTGDGDGDPTGDGDGDPTGDGDGDPTGDGDGDPGGDVTIYELQQGDVAEGVTVTVEGVVVTSPVAADIGLVFVEEPGAGEYSGIALYLWDEVVMSTQLQPGDVVDLVGEYTEYFDMSQLVIKNPADITVVGSDAVPGPDLVEVADIAADNPDAEPWEGVRVCADDVVVEESNDGFGQYLLQGGALVGNTFIDPLPQVQVGGGFTQVCGSMSFSFDDYKVLPTIEADLAGYAGPMATNVTIYEIQQGMVAEGLLVTLDNVTVSSGFTWTDGPDASFFVQEPGGGPFSGIEVHVADNAGVQITPGDDVTIEGVYEEFFDMSQVAVIDGSAITINGPGPAPAPELIVDPSTIATGGMMSEEYEGVLVSVEGVSVVDENPDAPDEFGEFAVTGDLRVDDLFFAINDWVKPAMGQGYVSITGPLVFAFTNFKLEPRDNADLVQE